MNKNFTREELNNMNAFQLWEVARLAQIPDYEHLVPEELIDAILAKQQPEKATA